MAIPAVNITWYGQGVGLSNAPAAFGQGTLPSQGGVSGSQSKALVGLATFVLDGATTTGLTANFIDGVQIPFKQVVVAGVSAVTAPATIGGVANQAVYSGVGAYGQLRVGQSITFAGFSNGGNNGTFTINALTTSTIQVTNASSVAETNPAATVTFNAQTSALPAAVQISRAIVGPTGVADTAATTTQVTETNMTSTGVVFTIGAAGTNLQTLSVLVELFPNQ